MRQDGRMSHTPRPPDPAWEWAREILARQLRGSGTVSIGWEREREWSRVRRLDLPDGGRAWLKELPPGLRSEVSIVRRLGTVDAPAALSALATDPEGGWMLLPDGGPTLQDLAGDADPDPAAWSATLAEYGRLQRAVEGLVPGLLADGVPDLRTPRLPELARELAARHAPQLATEMPRWERDAAVLDATGIAPSLHHDDLHAGNVFARGNVVFDWGDASIAHPWISLAVAVAVPAPATSATQSAYVTGWNLPDGVDLGRAVGAARRLGCVVRAATWARIDAAVGLPERFANAVPAWLELGASWPASAPASSG